MGAGKRLESKLGLLGELLVFFWRRKLWWIPDDRGSHPVWPPSDFYPEFSCGPVYLYAFLSQTHTSNSCERILGNATYSLDRLTRKFYSDNITH